MSSPRVNPALLRVQQAVGNHRYAHRVSTLAVATLADARTLPVSPDIERVLRAGLVPGCAHGLVRGRTYGCSGAAAVSCAMTLLREASATGSWIAWCAAVSPNWRAMADTGWALDRVVQIDCGSSRDGWVACLDALAGEIDIVVVDMPAGVSLRDAQQVIDRAVRRGGVVVVLAPSPEVHARLGVDVVFDVVRVRHVAHHAHLAGQVIDIRLQGRRVPVPTDVRLEIPGVAGG
jgi:hypothetical protein